MKELEEKLVTLVIRSEERIDKISTTIEHLVNVTDNVCNQYIHHIDSLTDHRKQLLNQIDGLNKSLNDERKRNDELVNKILHCRSLLNGSTNNIKIE